MTMSFKKTRHLCKAHGWLSVKNFIYPPIKDSENPLTVDFIWSPVFEQLQKKVVTKAQNPANARDGHDLELTLQRSRGIPR